MRTARIQSTKMSQVAEQASHTKTENNVDEEASHTKTKMLQSRPCFKVARDSCDVTHSLKQAYTPVISMLQKAVQSTHCTSCNQESIRTVLMYSWSNQSAHTNAIMLNAVKCSLYVVGPFSCRILHKSWSTGDENATNLLWCAKTNTVTL